MMRAIDSLAQRLNYESISKREKKNRLQKHPKIIGLIAENVEWAFFFSQKKRRKKRRLTMAVKKIY